MIINSLRELDALIAEKIFDATLEEGGRYGFPISEDLGKLWLELPEYSIKMSVAWDIVEKMKLFEDKHDNNTGEGYEDYFLRIQQTPSGYEIVKWIQADEYPNNYYADDVYKVYAKADTASLAICLAALKTKGIDVELNLE